MTATVPSPAGVAYNASLDGLRAVAAIGVLITHVAFQTGVDPSSNIGAIMARFDFFVAVFFALSAFLLWRSYGPESGRLSGIRATLAYLRSRAIRIVPAYVVCVVAVLALLPEAIGLNLLQVAANLTLTQVYVPLGLLPGLTHLWSLCIEVAFYAALPLLVVVLRPWTRGTRAVLIALLAVLSLGWAWLPFVVDAGHGLAESGVNKQIWPPAYTPWFAVGMLAAEAEGQWNGVPPRWVRRILRPRWAWWVTALAVAWLAGQEFFGPLGLEHPTPAEFALRLIAGTVFAALVVVPPALDPREGWLSSQVMVAVGRWSYSLFLWHVAVLALIFPLLGLPLFSGGFLIVFVVALVASVVIASASYVLVEKPAMELLGSRRGMRHASAATSASSRIVESPA